MRRTVTVCLHCLFFSLASCQTSSVSRSPIVDDQGGDDDVGLDPTRDDDPGGSDVGEDDDSAEPDGTDPTEPDGADPTEPDGTDPTEPDGTDPTDPDGTDPTDPDGTDPEDPQTSRARWTFLFFVNGDNNLEEWVGPDLDYYEEVGSADGIQIVVQADRIPGYSRNFGDWTDARRYYITPEAYNGKLVSEVVEYLGEVDMGSPDTLSDFLLWGLENYPAERTVLVFWDHGYGWEGVSDDETSGNSLSFTQGEVNEGLAAFVERDGPIALIVFDACNMASWEVAHSFQGYARYMAASETVMGIADGLLYAEAMRLVRDDPSVDADALGDNFARNAVEVARELTFSTVDIDALGAVTTAVDQLARAVLADDSLVQPLLEARNNARGTDKDWEEWYLDLNDFAVQLQGSDDTRLHGHGQAIQAGLDSAVIGAYGNKPWAWSGGLTIMFDTDYPQSLREYNDGAGATWSKDTQWGELLLYLADR